MLFHVGAICQILFGHVVGFTSRHASPQQDQDFKWVSASYVGSISYGRVGAILGPTSAILGLCWRLYRIIFYQRYTSETPPWPWRRDRIKSKTDPKHKNPAKMLTCMAVKAKRNQKSSQNPPSKRSPQWPCSLNLSRDWQNKGPPSRAIWDDDVFSKVTSSKATAPLARPAPTERCGRIFKQHGRWKKCIEAPKAVNTSTSFYRIKVNMQSSSEATLSVFTSLD